MKRVLYYQPFIAEIVGGGPFISEPCVLPGYRRRRIQDRPWPGIRPPALPHDGDTAPDMASAPERQRPRPSQSAKIMVRMAAGAPAQWKCCSGRPRA